MKLTLSVLAFVISFLPVRGDILLTDSFSYEDGVLQDVSGSKWVGHSGATNQVDVSAGAVNLTGSEAQDVNAGLTNGPFMADGGAALYAGFRITFSALPGKSGSYFAHFKSASGTGFRARIWSIKTPDGKFNLGISSVSSADPFALFPLELELNTEYRVVTKLDVATALATLWVNPTTESDTNVQSDDGAGLNITSFALRQSSGMGTMRMDDLIVATTFQEALGQTLHKPVILQQPANTNVFVGSTASFAVQASGPGTLTYQWLFNGADIPGQTTSTLEVSNATEADAGTYSVRVSNNDGSVVSTGATLTIQIPEVAPNITQQPSGRVVDTGDTVLFEVAVNGTEPLVYQWLLGDLELTGETQATLTLANVTIANSGTYKVRVTNSAGFALSLPATLLVREPVIAPGISEQPVSRIVDTGETVTFSVVASGTAPLAYQWFIDDFEFTGETGSTLTLLAVSVANAGMYKVRVSNSAESIFSDAATLIVNPPVIAPRIMQQPQNALVEVGGIVSFLAVATGTEPFTYQWLFNDFDLPGENGPVLTLLSVTVADAGEYKIRVTNGKGSALSQGAHLTVIVPTVSPTILEQPQGGTAETGGSFSFAVGASGTEPLTYQWNKDGQPLDGQNSSMLLLHNLTTNDTGSYSVRVGNNGGNIPSDLALLQVNPPPLIAPPGITFANYLSHLVRPGDLESNNFIEHALFVGETLRTKVAVTDPAGRAIELVINTNEFPSQAHWTASSTSSSNITADFEFTPSQGSAGRHYILRLSANNGFATNNIEWSIYVPFTKEQNIVLTEFLVNPVSDSSSVYFNPLHRTSFDLNASTDDQYVEIVNLSATAIDLMGWTVSDSGKIWQKFNDSFSLQSSNALVVYGGPPIGSEPMLETLIIPASENVSSIGLAADNGGMLTLRNAEGHLISRVVYESPANQSSMTRYPDSNGLFVPQETVGMSLFSPGKKWNGGPFAEAAPAQPISNLSIGTGSGHQVHLAWHAQPGQTYTVLRTTSMNKLFAPIGAGLQFPGENGEYTDVLDPSEAAFYIVRSP